MLADAAVTPAKLVAGTGTTWAWQSWTPTFTHWTIGTGGSAETTAKYIQIGKTVHFRIKSVLGSSGQSVGSDVSFTLPVTANSDYVDGHPIGQVAVKDQPPGYYPGFVVCDSSSPTTKGRLFSFSTSTNPTNGFAYSSTSPISFVAGDSIVISGTYEAA